MAGKHRVIPIFIPQKACPYKCVYCNQFAIAGQGGVPRPEVVEHIIQEHLATMPADAEKRIAFFGGSFTGMSIAEQNEYLVVAQPYIAQGLVSGIQLSTRPDYISQEILDNLKAHHVKIIELGAQSLDDDILRTVNRGHTVQQVVDASKMIIENGFQLGLQMMIGLPGDSKEKALHTAETISSLGAKFTRIYPTLVVENTLLAQWYRNGQYQPLSIEEAVDWSKDIYQFFLTKGIQVLRVGLHPSEGLLSGKEYIAGPFHVSFKELVLTAIWHERIQKEVDAHPDEEVIITVPAHEINYAVGYNSANRKAFPTVELRMEK